jgi:hypothetical protein
MDSEALNLLIAIPSNVGRAVVPTKFMFSLYNAMFQLNKDHPNINVILQQFNGLRVDAERQQMVAFARAKKCFGIIMIDDDMIIPANTFCRMIHHNIHGCSIISVLYQQKSYPFTTFLMPVESNTWLTAFEKDTVYKVRQLGTGCVFIDMTVFDIIQQPYFLLRTDLNGNISMTEDCYFALNCFNHGIEMIVDTSLWASHLDMYSIPEFVNHPYIHFRGESDINELPVGNCAKEPLYEEVDPIPPSVVCQEAVEGTFMNDGLVQCNHKNLIKLPTNENSVQLFKCKDCDLITRGIQNVRR